MCYFFKGLVVDDADDYDHMIYDENDYRDDDDDDDDDRDDNIEVFFVKMKENPCLW